MEWIVHQTWDKTSNLFNMIAATKTTKPHDYRIQSI